MSERSVIVIGGGVIGVSSAYYLARDGWEVTLLEKGEICAGSSYGNAGLIVPSHLVPLAAPGVWWQGVKWMLNPESPFYIRPRASLELARWLWRFRAACTPGRVRRAMPLLRRLSVESLELYRGFAEKDLDFGFRQSGSMTVFSTPGEEARSRGYAELTLTTYADVPWNAPFYAARGFRVVDDPAPYLQRQRAHEREQGYDRHGPRVAMSRPLGALTPTS